MHRDVLDQARQDGTARLTMVREFGPAHELGHEPGHEPGHWRCLSGDATSDGMPDLARAADGTTSDRARVLIVEDNYFVGLTIENALADAGYDVLAVVESGEAALATAAEARPDLVLMDIRLAGALDGIDTAIALQRSGIVSLFASAHSRPRDQEAGRRRATGRLAR